MRNVECVRSGSGLQAGLGRHLATAFDGRRAPHFVIQYELGVMRQSLASVYSKY